MPHLHAMLSRICAPSSGREILFSLTRGLARGSWITKDGLLSILFRFWNPTWPLEHAWSACLQNQQTRCSNPGVFTSSLWRAVWIGRRLWSKSGCCLNKASALVGKVPWPASASGQWCLSHKNRLRRNAFVCRGLLGPCSQECRLHLKPVCCFMPLRCRNRSASGTLANRRLDFRVWYLCGIFFCDGCTRLR